LQPSARQLGRQLVGTKYIVYYHTDNLVFNIISFSRLWQQRELCIYSNIEPGRNRSNTNIAQSSTRIRHPLQQNTPLKTTRLIRLTCYTSQLWKYLKPKTKTKTLHRVVVVHSY